MVARMQVLLIGAGGHAREIANYVVDLQEHRDISLRGLAADWGFDEELWDRLFDIPHVGGVEKAATTLKPGYFIVGVGDSAARHRLADLFLRHGWLEPEPLVHPTAYVAGSARLDPGSLVFPHARVGVAAHVARQAHVTVGATVGHDTVVGDASSLFPSAVLSGSVTVGARCTVGTGAVVLEGRRIADDVIVGGGALVNRDVERAGIVIGVPARPLSRKN
jgi:sugar O-acyltransferase (sialic acid O-acetyltransferase NeuD family)